MTTSRKSTLISIFATLLCLVVITRPSAAQSYNAAGDFSSTSNPNGAWSYGWSTTLGSAFNLDSINTNSYAGLGLSGWLGNTSPGGEPYALYNGTAHAVTNVVSVYQPGQLAEHPGAQGEYAVVRWTTPSSGTFNIAATFSGLSAAGDSVDVHILYDDTSIFNSTVFGSPAPASFSGPQSVLAGDTIDFAVGYGNGDPNEDTTALSASIVPEPGTLGLVGMGFGCLLSLRFRKRTQGNERPVPSPTTQSPNTPSLRKATLISTVATFLCLAALTLPSTASAYSAAGDFSTSSNPNGPWSYGWSYGAGAAFHLDVTNSFAYSSTPLSGWLGHGSATNVPYVLHNGTANPVTLVVTTYQPGQLAEHPGFSNEVAVVRWTAPSSGTFNIAATFSGLSSFGDSTDVHILYDGTSIFNSTVFGSPAPASFSGPQSVLAGDTIDFVVGNGGNGDPNEDTTALSASIVPEPATLGLVGMGFGCLLSLRFLKRK